MYSVYQINHHYKMDIFTGCVAKKVPHSFLFYWIQNSTLPSWTENVLQAMPFLSVNLAGISWFSFTYIFWIPEGKYICIKQIKPDYLINTRLAVKFIVPLPIQHSIYIKYFVIHKQQFNIISNDILTMLIYCNVNFTK